MSQDLSQLHNMICKATFSYFYFYFYFQPFSAMNGHGVVALMHEIIPFPQISILNAWKHN